MAISSTNPADIPVFLERFAAGYDIVSGWRKVRVDNFWMRRIPSRMCNWLMPSVSASTLHGLRHNSSKPYRRENPRAGALYGELTIASFPGAASWYGGIDCRSAHSANINRERGLSHYGISRTIPRLLDLIHNPVSLRYFFAPLHSSETFRATQPV